MTPLDTNGYVTAWIPLRPIGTNSTGGGRGQLGGRQGKQGATAGSKRSGGGSGRKASQPVVAPEQLDDSGLLFAEGSHRDFALPFWHDLRDADLSTRGYSIVGTGERRCLHCLGCGV